MMVRDPMIRVASANLGVAQNMRCKSAISSQDDVECFQRLAGVEMSLANGQDGQNIQAPDLLADDETLLAGAHLSSFHYPEMMIKASPIWAQLVQIKQAETKPELQQTHPKKPQINACEASHGLDRKGLVIGRNPPFQSHTVLYKTHNKLDAELDAKSVPTAISKLGDPALIMAGHLMPVGLTHGQTSKFRIADLPNVTRVQIEQIKRDTAGVLTSLELVLEPVELGRITAKIQHEDGKIILVLSAEHRAIADDLARDSGLLLRVLGDHIPGVNKTAVFVQTEGQQAQTSQGQGFAEFTSSNRQHKQFLQAREDLNGVQSIALNEMQTLGANATGLQVRI